MKKLQLLFAIAVLPIVAGATTFGPETPVAPAQLGLAIGSQVATSLACSSQSCLTLWTEGDFHQPGLFSSVINGDGTVPPAGPNLLRTGFQGGSALVWATDHYLAVWNDGETHSLVAARLSSGGLLTGEVQIVASPLLQNVAPSSLAWNGHRALVTYVVPGGFQAALVDADGHLIRTITVLSSQPLGWAVAAAGDTFAVVWGAQGPAPAISKSIYMQRFDDGGTPIDAAPVVLASSLSLDYPNVGVASNGSQFGVAFMSAPNGTLQRLRVDRASGSVDRLSTAAFALYNGQSVGVFWSGDDFVAYASDINNVDSVRFTSDTLEVLNVSTGFINEPQIVQGPSGAVAVWIDPRPTGYDQHIVGAILDRDATAITKNGLTVSRSSRPQTKPALALSPAGALLVWQIESGNERADLVATRLDRAGVPIDSTPIAVASPVGSHNPRSVVWLGDDYLVIYPYIPGIVAKRIAASGAVLDADPIVIGKGSYAAVASNGTTTIVATSDANGSVRVVRLSAAAAVIDTQTIATSSHISNHLAVATNGDEFVVAWTEDHGDGAEIAQDDIFAVRLTASGLPIDASSIVIANTSHDETSPAIASDGRDFLIAYTDQASVALKRLLREGTVVNSSIFPADVATDPQVVFAADRYFLTWGAGTAGRITTVNRGGAVIDAPSVFAQSDSNYVVQTALAPGLVAYSRGNAADNGIPRLFTRQIVFFPQTRGRAVHH